MPKRGKTIISVSMDVGSSAKPSLTVGAEVWLFGRGMVACSMADCSNRCMMQ